MNIDCYFIWVRCPQCLFFLFSFLLSSLLLSIIDNLRVFQFQAYDLYCGHYTLGDEDLMTCR